MHRVCFGTFACRHCSAISNGTANGTAISSGGAGTSSSSSGGTGTSCGGAGITSDVFFSVQWITAHT